MCMKYCYQLIGTKFMHIEEPEVYVIVIDFDEFFIGAPYAMPHAASPRRVKVFIKFIYILLI